MRRSPRTWTGSRWRRVVSHQAGLPGLTTPVTCEESGDDVRMAQLLAAQPALHPRGAGLYYHALTFGWLCGELVRRVDLQGPDPRPKALLDALHGALRA